MKISSERLSSLTFTSLLLVALLFWLTWGILMAGSGDYMEGFGLMNSRLLREWLIDPNGDSILKFWFAGLCFLMGLLGVNLIFCTWNKILRIMRVRFAGPRLLMLVIHMVFGFVALGHLGGFMLGYRYEKVLLGEGQSFSIREGYALEVERIGFVDDPKVLKKSPRELTADEFHYRQNFADIVLSRDGEEVLKRRVYLLKPTRHDMIQTTLARFVPRKGSESVEGMPRAMFVVSKNPVLVAFLAVYGVMVVGMGVYLAMTWKKPKNE